MSWTLSGTIDGTGFDTDIVGWRFTITYGRQEPSGQPNPTQLTATVVSSDPAILDDWQIGKLVELFSADTGYTTQRLFRGAITDCQWDGHRLQIIAVSNGLGSLNRTVMNYTGIGGGGRFDQLVQQMITDSQLAGAAPGWSNPFIASSEAFAMLDIPDQTAVNVGQFISGLTASEPNGFVAEQFGVSSGSPSFFVSAYFQRNPTPIAGSIDLSGYTAALLDGWTATRRVADKVNSAAVTWSGGVAQYSDPTSVSTYGPYAVSANTYVADSTQAEYLASRLVQRNLQPFWRLTGIRLDMMLLSPADRALFANALTGELVELPELWTGAQTLWWLEGFVDSIGYSNGAHHWVRELFLSDYDQTAAAQQWDEVTPTLVWDSVPGTVTWNDTELLEL